MKILQGVADSLGVPEDQLRMIVLILSSYPLSLINYQLKNATIRLWYGFITGFMLQYLMYGNDCIHLILATTFTYLFMRFYGRKLSAFWVLAGTVIHLSVLHIYRMLKDWGGWELDSTTIYMMSICKFSAIAFSYEDGGKSDTDIKNSYHRAKKIVERPSLLETFSYIYYYPSAVMGPSFEFSDFRQYINLQGCFEKIPFVFAIKSALIELSKSLLNILSVLFLLKKFDFNYCLTEEYANKSLLYKHSYYNISMFIQRTKYYGGWKMAQSAIVFSGLGYNPSVVDSEDKTSKGEFVHNFNRVENCVIRDVEIEMNPRRRIQYWNRTVHLWLKYNLFLRLLNVETKPFKNNRGLASLITFMVSAFWHGFYPVYYIFFFLFFLLEQICTILEEDYDFFKKVEKQNIIIRYAFSLFTMSFCNYLGIVFVLIDIKKAWTFSKSVQFVPAILLISIFLVLRHFNIKNKKRLYKEKKEKEMMKTTPNGEDSKTK